MNRFDPILGIHAKALSMWGRRTEVLAANIANADTPNYKARDIDFQAALGRAKQIDMHTTHASHQRQARLHDDAALMYRTPLHPSLDGNSVEADVEQAKFGENALRYQASLRFLSGRVKSLRAAISGSHQ
ncbi:MAG: flagellar basal body rod protein FlgB [Pseudomonadota bacterium]